MGPGGRVNGARRRKVSWSLTVGLGVAALGGCSTEGAADGEAELTEPFAFALVEDVVHGPRCPEEYQPTPDDTECLALSEHAEVHTVTSIELAEPLDADGEPTGEAIVEIELLPEAAEQFAALTEAASASGQGRIAFLVDGAVVSAPTVVERIDGGHLALSGWDASQARDFVNSVN